MNVVRQGGERPEFEARETCSTNFSRPFFRRSVFCLSTAVFGLLLFLMRACIPCASAATGWTLVWADEFTQADGSSPDPMHWIMETGGHGWGNDELQTYTSRTNNCRIENGHLVLEAHRETYKGTDGIERDYTSARLKTQGKVSWTFGRIEARIRIPRGQGIWPAFWMLGTNITSVGWPACGEIDIMENIGSEPARVHGALHGPGYSGGNPVTGSHDLPGGGAFADDFHVFAVEWHTNLIRWLVDDEPYMTATPASLPAGRSWVFNTPHFLLLNVAVGGRWPGSPNASTTFPQRMTVDYVRVYAGTNAPDCKENALFNPGFENGLANWTSYGDGFNTQVQHSSSGPVHSGTNSFKMFGRFNGGENYSGAFQDQPCAPGDVFQSEAWIYTKGSDRIAGANEAWLEISFRSGANVLSLFRSAVFDATTTPDSWRRFEVNTRVNPATGSVIEPVTQLVAPAGSSVARCQVVFKQVANAAGSVFVDDVNFNRGPAPDLPVRPAASTVNGALEISFPTFLGFQYEIRRSQDLGTLDWQIVTNLAGDGRPGIYTETLEGGPAFYQVRRLCN